MNRRTLLKAICAICGIGLCASSVWEKATGKYGYVNMARVTDEGWFGRCSAFLDGVDVSDGCFALDDVRGFVDVYKSDEHGKRYIRDDEVAHERLFGQVRFVVYERPV